jgi:DNA-directed RNA polymerase
MATTKGKENSTHWIQSAWELFDIMERGHEKVAPTPGTYAIILMAWLRYFREILYSQ